jgi:glycosyltransferase involved in cell wall biosynthesis
MHVAYFSNQFADRHGHGLARYSRELFAALNELNADVSVTPVSAWSSLPSASLDVLRRRDKLRLLPTGRRLTPLLWTLLDAPPVESWLSRKVDVVHAASLGYPVATRKPFVVTIHDLGPLTHPEYFENARPWVMRRSLGQALRQASALICVSNSTAEELMSFGAAEISAPLHVIPEGVSDFFFESANPACLAGLPGLRRNAVPFVLAAGKISPRKNVQGLLRAMTRLLDRLPHHLVLVGADGWGLTEVLRELKDPVLARRTHRLGFVTDEQLRALYSAASVYVHPSLYEGFGLTVLEAMATGCPVITSAVYSLPEVAGKAAILVEPNDVEAIADAIEAVCLNPSMADDLRAHGRRRAATFRWENCARQVAEVYRALA